MKNNVISVYLVLIIFFFSCVKKDSCFDNIKQEYNSHPEFISDGFDFPVGKPNAIGYYNANKFRENNHLGEDWNGLGGGNTDLGDTIFSIANGYVYYTKNVGGGWGNVIRIIHKIHPEKDRFIESVYAHCDTILIKEGEFVKRGQKIGTIGNCKGKYLAHLHFEIRDKVLAPIGGGYSKVYKGFLNPTEFIENNRVLNYK